MRPEPRRNLVIADAMILVAATAIGLAYIQATLFDLADRLQRTRHPGTRHLIAVQYAMSVLLPLVTAWTPVLLLIRLRTLRPRLALRQPGTVADAAATVAMIILAPVIVAEWAGGKRFAQFEWTFLIQYCPYIGFAVIGGWAGLILGGRWRSEPYLIDRVGRVLGCLWIGATLLSLASPSIVRWF